MTASDTNRTLCSDHLKGPSIWGVMGAGSEINPTLHIVLQLSYIYILDEQSQTDLVWSSIGETAAHYHSTATSTTQHSRAQHNAGRWFMIDRGMIIVHINRNTDQQKPHRKRLLTSECSVRTWSDLLQITLHWENTHLVQLLSTGSSGERYPIVSLISDSKQYATVKREEIAM